MNTRGFIFTILSAGLLFFVIYPVCATIVSGAVTGGKSLAAGGKFVKLSVPFRESRPENTVGRNNFQTHNLYGFDEGQNIDISVDLKVDILADGRGGGRGPGTIPASITVASHYVFFDPRRGSRQSGSITFDSYIIGVISSTRNLKASDFLVNTSVRYLNPGMRGIERKQDTVKITGLRTISVDWVASSPGDYIRVLTLFSPGAVTSPTPGTRPPPGSRPPPTGMGL